MLAKAFDVCIDEIHVAPVQIQGPKSETLHGQSLWYQSA
jgi:hypothetical protein